MRFWATVGEVSTDTNDQLTPFHLRKTHPFVVPPVLLPTAQPSFAETIKTELRFWPVGEATLFQLVPFHRMIVPPCPTAQPSFAETIKTELRFWPVGEATLFQLAP
ncbi:MAG: hypothetical protein GW872_02525, partial [Nitrospirae bacterium]|nr:hypothetical protein [Nitrospirota bacterium]